MKEKRKNNISLQKYYQKKSQKMNRFCCLADQQSRITRTGTPEPIEDAGNHQQDINYNFLIDILR